MRIKKQNSRRAFSSSTSVPLTSLTNIASLHGINLRNGMRRAAADGRCWRKPYLKGQSGASPENFRRDGHRLSLLTEEVPEQPLVGCMCCSCWSRASVSSSDEPGSSCSSKLSRDGLAASPSICRKWHFFVR